MPTSNIKLPYGLSTHLQRRTSSLKEAEVPVKRREQPARRTDQIQSVYITPEDDPAHAQEPLNDYDLAIAAKRRHSDPPVYPFIPRVNKSDG